MGAKLIRLRQIGTYEAKSSRSLSNNTISFAEEYSRSHDGTSHIDSEPVRTTNTTLPQTTSNARFSTYSGAPSLQPSLAPTYESSQPSARNSHVTSTAPTTNEKKQIYTNPDLASSSTLSTSDPKSADIKSWSGALERMQDARLDKQRYVMSDNKGEEVSKLALGAKVERALSRRMVGQDATFKPSGRGEKKGMDSEKRSLEVQAN